jgi:hypothetical protein
MQYLLAALVIAPVVVLVTGAVRGRVRVQPCCSDPAMDGRMAAAFADDDAEVTSPRARG